MNDLRRYNEILKRLTEDIDGKERKKLKQELTTLNLLKCMVRSDTRIAISEQIADIDAKINHMWQVFANNESNLMALLWCMFDVECVNIQNLETEERQRPKNLILDYASLVHIEGKNKERRYHVDDAEDRFISMVNGNFVRLQDIVWIRINKIIESIRQKLEPSRIERMITLFARSLCRRGIIDANRVKTLGIILSSGFWGNHIVTSYMIPAQIEYILLKTLEENKQTITCFRKDGTMFKDITLDDIFGDESRLNSVKQYIDSNILDEFKYLFKHNNIRNNLYHGKCDDDIVDNGYMWYLFCRLLYITYKKNR
ncbi:MAG: hypothetical protein WCG04_05305 [Alphaproteobacteria bacterium]